MVVTSLRVHMLEISSRDLRRFGRKAVDAVQHYTRLRSRWHMQRLESCIAATAAAAEAIVKLSQAEPNDQRPKTPDKEESSPLGPRLISAQAMMARRRSDSGPGVAQGSRLSMDLPPQLGRALKPPPEQRGRFPQLRHMSGDSERTVNRIWSMPAQRAPAPAVLNQRRFSMGAAEIDNTLKPIAEAQAETRAMLARGLDSEVLAPLSQHYTMHSLEFPPIKGASKDLRPQGRGKHPADASPEESDLSSPPETPNSKRRPWAPVGSSRQGTSSSRSPASNGNKGKLSHGRVMLESARSKSIAGAEQDPKIRIEGTRA